MKKLIAISVVFVLLATAAFAVDLGGTVIATVDLAGASDGGDAVVLGNGGVGRVRHT
jgi:predicted porin